MGFWLFLFVCSLLVPLLMIVCGRMMWQHTPQKINSVIGYRTARSMQNDATWLFAHDYCGKLWWKIGWVMLTSTIAIFLPFYHGSENVIGAVSGILCIVQCAILLASIVSTERALKKYFA